MSLGVTSDDIHWGIAAPEQSGGDAGMRRRETSLHIVTARLVDERLVPGNAGKLLPADQYVGHMAVADSDRPSPAVAEDFETTVALGGRVSRKGAPVP